MDSNTVGLAALLVLVALVLGVGAVFFAVVSQGSGSAAQQHGAEGSRSGTQEPEAEEEDVMLYQARPRGGRNQGALRRRAAAAAAAQHQQRAQELEEDSQQASDSDTGSEEDTSQDEAEEGAGPAQDQAGRRTKKQRNREARRAEREAQRAAQEVREARAGQANRYDELRRQREAAREAKERALEEEAQRMAEEKARREEEEAAKWMGQITVEAEGTDEAADGGDAAGLLGRFVDYITTRKTVPLEQLAVDFRLRTSDVIDRIAQLEAMGRLTGIMDDRGKFIYISREEMQAVADYLVAQGRVTITGLAAKSSTLIDLEPKEAASSLTDTDLDALLLEATA